MSVCIFESLTKFSLYEGLPPQTLKDLGISPKRRLLNDGEFLFHDAETSTDVCFIVSGHLICVLFSSSGQEVTFSRINAGQYLGELSAIDDQARSLSVYARNQTELITLSQPDFMAVLDSVSEVRLRVMRNMAAMIRRLTARSYETTSLSVDARVRSFLVKLALENQALYDGGVISSAPTHSQIASEVGANREAVSRAISSLKKTGIIDAGRQRLQILQSETLLESLDL